MKNGRTEINDGLYYDERSAGGLVYKKENNKILWLLIKTISNFTSEKNKKRENDGAVYKFPKGHLKKDEFLKEAALREVEEEGRVKAKIVTKLGSNDYLIWDKEQKKKIIKKVTFFLMEYTEQSNLKYYDTEMVLEREWFEFDEASEKLAYDSEKVLLKKAKIELDKILKPLCR
ncbi:MAG TPA: NUDIX domain-containing protein [Candidatus Woesebacteria bacterium]|nr:NUDIX domain-containing protein [Candidatus Woesebacteria bacterium]